MDVMVYIKGVIIGVAVSAPLGPMAMMVVQRCLNQGRKTGFVSGLGVATADTVFAIVAGFGLSIIIDFLSDNMIIFKLMGAALLIFLGIRLFTRNPAVERRKALKRQNANLWNAYLSMVIFTLSNPAFLLIHGGIFAAFGLLTKGMLFNNLLFLVLGVASGAVLWWLFLTWVLHIFGKNIKLRILLWINRIAGIAILIFGLLVLISIKKEDTGLSLSHREEQACGSESGYTKPHLFLNKFHIFVNITPKERII